MEHFPRDVLERKSDTSILLGKIAKVDLFSNTMSVAIFADVDENFSQIFTKVLETVESAEQIDHFIHILNGLESSGPRGPRGPSPRGATGVR